MSREEHYRRLLALYPSDHRRQHGEEMLGVLLAANGGWRDDVNLVGGAVALHTRRALNLDGGVPLRDVMAIVSLLGPVVLLAGAAPDLHDVLYSIKTGGLLVTVPQQHVPDWPVWAAWLVATALTLVGARRPAAAIAWVACVAHLVIISAMPVGYAAHYESIGLLLLGVFSATALTWSAGPARGRELVGRRGVQLAFAGVALTAVLLVVTPSSHAVGFWAYQLGPWLASAASGFGGCLACRRAPDRRTGRHAAFVLTLPLVATVVIHILIGLLGPALFWTPVVASALFYGVPTLIVLAGNGVLSRIRKSLAS
jgi:hypothetical protein